MTILDRQLPLGTFGSGTQPLLPLQGDPYTRHPVSPTAPLPDVHTIQEAAQEADGIARLRVLAAKSGQPVLADYYRCLPTQPGNSVPAPAAPTGNPAADGLNRLALTNGQLWWNHGKTLLCRKQDWYTQRLTEIPDRWMWEVVKTLTEQKDIPTYADVLRLRELTDAQLSGLISLSDLPMRTDQKDISGLRTLLEIVAGSPDRMQGPLFPGCTILPAHATLEQFDQQNRLLLSVIDRISLTFPQLSPAQRALLPVFADAQPNPLPAAGIDQFDARLTRGESYRGESRCRHVPIELVWAWGTTAASQFLCLPLSVPDDRADKTRIEAVR